jgi:hypothetical protein
MGRLKRVFSAWREGKRGRTEPPPPDPSVPVTVHGRGETVVEVLSDGPHRIGIARDRGGIYRLYPETWAQDWDSLRREMWFPSGAHAGLICDSLERARSLARETLDEMNEA